MRKGLFRTQATQTSHYRLQGEVLVTPRLSYMVTGVILLLWLIAVIVFLSTREYTRRASVSGWLQPPQGIIRQYASNNGRVATVLVKAGEKVTQGQPLVILDYSQSLKSGEAFENTLLAEYQQQYARISQQLSRQTLLEAQETRRLQSAIAQAKQTLKQLNAMQELIGRRQTLNSDQLTALQQVSQQGGIARHDLDQARDTALALAQERKQVERDYLETQSTLAAQLIALEALPAKQQNERDALLNQGSELQLKITQLQRQQGITIRASSTGEVSRINVHEGQFVATSKPLLTLLPENSELEAKLLVPVREAGFIAKGQTVEFRFDAFPYQKFGVHHGTVVAVSSTLVLPGELDATPSRVNEPAYLVTAHLNDQALTAYGHAVALKSGMTLSANVALSKRTLLEWLFEPLLTLSGRL